MTDRESRYGGVAIFYRWLMAVLVVIVGTLGLLHDSWPHATQAKWTNVHAVIGLAVWLLLMLRFGGRLSHRGALPVGVTSALVENPAAPP